MKDKTQLEIKQITKGQGTDFIAKYHYRKIMPKLNKVLYGGFIDGELVAVVTFGYGTQPANTIKKIFPTLTTADYFEVGRLCLVDELGKNSESYFMSRVFDLLKKDFPNIQVVFSWSDGIMGKAGFVYQALNFMYAGKIKTDVYITKEGYLVHPRSAKCLLELNAMMLGKEKLCWLTKDFLALNSITRLQGYQFKYVYFVCNKRVKRDLLRSAVVPINKDYPKTKDIKFFSLLNSKSTQIDFPVYKETLSSSELKDRIAYRGGYFFDVTPALEHQANQQLPLVVS